MNCPSCGSGLTGQERCPSCGSIVAPVVDGALAPVPQATTPPARAKLEPIREIPALRRREKERDWRDEVRERVRSRRSRRGGTELPLFEKQSSPSREAEEVGRGDRLPAAEQQIPRNVDLGPLATTVRAPRPAPEVAPVMDLGDARLDVGRTAAKRPEAKDSISEAAWDDLPLAPVEPAAMDDLKQALAAMSRQAPPERSSSLLGAESEDETDDWTAAAPHGAPTRSAERPAEVSERLQAASIDALIIGLLAALASYSAARVVQVPVAGLSPVWPWLAFWIALFSGAYAAYFTGTTGQTPGKMLIGLRVVAGTGAGLPPRYVPALLRAVMGSCGNAVLLGLIPMLFDPARRGLHDRVFRTRVIKR